MDRLLEEESVKDILKEIQNIISQVVISNLNNENYHGQKTNLQQLSPKFDPYPTNSVMLSNVSDEKRDSFIPKLLMMMVKYATYPLFMPVL